MNSAHYPHLGVSSDFYTAYVSRFKNDYQIAYAGNAHDISMVIGNSFNVISEKPNATQVIEKLKSVTNHKGVGGSFGFIENEKDGPHFHFPVQLKKIVDGRIETVE